MFYKLNRVTTFVCNTQRNFVMALHTGSRLHLLTFTLN